MTPFLRWLLHRESAAVTRIQEWTPVTADEVDTVDIEQIARVELILMLEKAQLDNASAFVCIAIDTESGDVLTCTGPFAQAEQAFLQGCQDEATWRQQKTEEDGAIEHVVLPIWAAAA